MTHPLEHLAGFVDGTLAPAERAAVDGHLRSCARCRDEVAMAAAARRALRETPVPDSPDLASRFSPDRIAASTSRAAPSPLWSKVVPALAAAAVVALVALAVPRLGSSSGDEAAAPAADSAVEAGAEATAGPLQLQADDTDYDVAALDEAAIAFAASLASGDAALEPTPNLEDASATGPGESRFAGQEPQQAFTCLRRAFRGFPGQIVQLRRASFEGTPAYLGFVLESPGAGAPPDILSVWVAAVEDCSILTLTSVRL